MNVLIVIAVEIVVFTVFILLAAGLHVKRAVILINKSFVMYRRFPHYSTWKHIIFHELLAYVLIEAVGLLVIWVLMREVKSIFSYPTLGLVVSSVVGLLLTIVLAKNLVSIGSYSPTYAFEIVLCLLLSFHTVLIIHGLGKELSAKFLASELVETSFIIQGIFIGVGVYLPSFIIHLLRILIWSKFLNIRLKWNDKMQVS